MLLIFGATVRFKVLATIAFFCPNCGVDRQGTRRSARRWYTFFFIPLIPGKELGEVVDCDTCRARFDPAVLERPTTATLDAAHTDAVRVLGALVAGAGDPSNEALRTAAVASIGSVVPGYDAATLASDLAAIDPASATRYAEPLADGLATPGKEQFLSGLARIAVSGGGPTPGQQALLDDIGRTLGLSAAYVVGIVATARNTTGPAGPTLRP